MDECEHDGSSEAPISRSNEKVIVSAETSVEEKEEKNEEIMRKQSDLSNEKNPKGSIDNEPVSPKRRQTVEEKSTEEGEKEPLPKKRCKSYVPEIELGMWPKFVKPQGTSLCTQQQQRYPATQHKLHRPWETRGERYGSYPIRPRASLPRTGFITEFGHLGFQDHWKQVIHTKSAKLNSERAGSFSRHLGIIGSEENWALRPAQFYASYFGQYGRAVVPLSRECFSCLPAEHHGCIFPGGRDAMGAFDKHINVAAERFRLHFAQHEEGTAKQTPTKGRPTVEDGKQKKHGLVTYWPKSANENPCNARLKSQRMTSSPSPTFEYIRGEKTKEAQDRPFSCTICEKSFKRRSSLATHKFIHTDLKPHVCGECNKRFLRKSDLKKHGLMHSGKKPYQCEKCGRRFSQSSNMLTHLRRHMGIRPFECNICARSFFRKVDLKRHEGRHIAKTMKSKCETN